MKKLLVTTIVTLTVCVLISAVSLVQAQTIIIPRSILSGEEEVPPVTTTAGGLAHFTLNEAGTELSFNIAVANITNITAAHIHVGAPGVNGPIIFTLASSPSAFVNGVAEGRLTAANLMPQPDLGVRTFADALDAIFNSGTYANVHTQANPNGEIRGQIFPVTYITIPVAGLNGDEEVPPVTTRATGIATFALNDAGTALGYSLAVGDITNITAAHIHVGTPGINGPIIFTLASGPSAFVDGVATGTLTAASLMPQEGIATFADAIQAIYAGATYANVHTQANPNGEIRGQIILAPVEVPPASANK